jgi:hypothetical protein
MKYLKEICKVGQGTVCCRYIVAGTEGITCAKLTPLKDEIDHRVKAGLFIAQGDNCEGITPARLLPDVPLEEKPPI